jgi:Zn-dependent protease
LSHVTEYFSWWRTTVVRHREIVDAEVDPAHSGPSPELEAALAGWPGHYYWAAGDGPGRLTLTRPLGDESGERWWLHGVLFLATFFTVWMGGALLAGSSLPWEFPFSMGFTLTPSLMSELLTELVTLRSGLAFAVALMAILLSHEMGHYLVAKRYGVDTSPPYFLPSPPLLNFIGTFGAFIRLRSPIVDRQQLMDVGAAGPWAGFAVALVVLFAGLTYSTVVPEVGPSEQLIVVANLHLYVGDSVVSYAARHLVIGDGTVMLHPLAFAGWLGVLVTMLNLLPLTQLDGGHVLYALVGKYQAKIGPFVWLSLIALGFMEGQWWWWVWAAVILMLGRGRLAHPQVLDPYRSLPRSRRPVGILTLLLFVVTFCPVPVHYSF